MRVRRRDIRNRCVDKVHLHTSMQKFGEPASVASIVDARKGEYPHARGQKSVTAAISKELGGECNSSSAPFGWSHA